MFLLDTCVLIWLEQSQDKIPAKVMDVLVSPENRIFVSIVSFWELGLKASVQFTEQFSLLEYEQGLRDKYGFELMNIQTEACDQLRKLPDIHRDPFDRMLIAQSLVAGARLVTPDKLIRQYPLPILW